MTASFVLDTMSVQDWPQVRAIFGEGLATGLAAFRKTPPVWKDWDAGHLKIGRIVARHINAGDVASDEGDRGGRILGWGALAPVADG